MILSGLACDLCSGSHVTKLAGHVTKLASHVTLSHSIALLLSVRVRYLLSCSGELEVIGLIIVIRNLRVYLIGF